MPVAPAAPAVSPKPPVGEIDPKSLLLPHKDAGPNKDSAQRINAGALLASEQGATLLTPEGTAKKIPTPNEPAKPSSLDDGQKSGLPSGQPTARTGDPRTFEQQPAKAVFAEEETNVKPLQTYRGDIESVVADQNISVVNIAAAEAERRGELPQTHASAIRMPKLSLSISMIVAGAVLLIGAVGIITFVILRPSSLPVIAQAPSAPFMTVDESNIITVAKDASRSSVMSALTKARNEVKLSLGLTEWLFVAHPATAESNLTSLTGAEFLSLIAPNIPQELLRTVQPTFLLGVHSFDENQPFLVLQVDSYGTAFASMLQWERTMQGELSPLFTRTPSPKVQSPAITQIDPNATTTEPEAPTVFIPTSFVDKVLENRDVRAIVGKDGDVLLLWTFLGRNTILITTNEYTLREVVSRINTPPVVHN